jgi:steroid delta-isomerase-like uncharacterized protein
MRVKAVVVAALLLSVYLVVHASATKPAGRELVEREFSAWNSHDPDRVVAFFTDDVTYEDVTYGMVAHGHPELRKMAADFFAAVPDLKLEVVNTRLDKNGGWVEWTFSGTDVGLYKTGKKFSVRGVSVFEIRQGKFAADRDYYDSANIMRQVGVLPKTTP